MVQDREQQRYILHEGKHRIGSKQSMAHISKQHDTSWKKWNKKTSENM